MKYVLYNVLVVVPTILQMFTDSMALQLVCLGLSLIFQVLLVIYEVIQIKQTSRADYQKDTWNLLDWFA